MLVCIIKNKIFLKLKFLLLKKPKSPSPKPISRKRDSGMTTDIEPMEKRRREKWNEERLFKSLIDY